MVLRKDIISFVKRSFKIELKVGKISESSVGVQMLKFLEKSVAYALCYVVRYYGKTNKFTNLTAFEAIQ